MSFTRRKSGPPQFAGAEPQYGQEIVFRQGLAPVFNPGPAASVTHVENQSPTAIAQFATLSDSDSPDFNGGSLTVSIAGATAFDQLAVRHQGTAPGQIGLSGANVTYGGVTIGTVGGGANGSALVVSLNANASVAAVAALVRDVTYATSSETVWNDSKTFTLIVNDGDGEQSQIQTGMAVRGANDAPTLVNFDAAPAVWIAGAAPVRLDAGADAVLADIDSATFGQGSLTVSIVSAKAAAEDVLGFVTDARVSLAGNVVSVDGVVIGTVSGGGAGGGDLVFAFLDGATPASVSALIHNLTYWNSDPTPTDGTRTVKLTFRDGDGTDNFGTDTVEASVQFVVGTGVQPPPTPQPWPADSIVPPIPAAPAWTPNWTNTQYVDQAFQVSAGQYLYSTSSLTMISHLGGGTLPLVNNGTMWMDGTLEPNLYTAYAQFMICARFSIVNHGIAVQRAYEHSNVDYGDAVVFGGMGNLENTGQIFAWAENGDARTVWSDLHPAIVNSGLIAGVSLIGTAVAIGLSNGGSIINSAGGQILAEGAAAIAISDYNANDEINNAGLIQARATHPAIASIGISLAHLSLHTVRIVNSGTITADIAILDRSAQGSYSPPQASIQIVANQASGVINGDIDLGWGNDQLINAGTINGYVLMGDHDDNVANSGVVNGVVELGAGADLFTGSSAADFVAGDDGNDRMEGNGGNDQLMGGANDDVLIGGAGNDGLFGEHGNDRIVTLAGDFAWGGSGDDRIELGDYAFERVSGNEGFDILVLPAGARLIDLSLVLAEQALGGIEKIVLGGGKELAVRSADVPVISDGGNILWIEGGASDRVDLVGAWVEGGTQTLDGVAYRRFDLAGQIVYVASAAMVSVQAAGPAGATGLDPFAGGDLAPVPSDGFLDFTQTYFYRASYQLTAPLTLTPDQTWWNDVGQTVVRAATGAPGLAITNHGHILSVNGAYGNVTALNLDSIIQLYNDNTIRAVSTWSDSIVAPDYEDDVVLTWGTIGGQTIINDGLIEAAAVHGTAQGAARPGLLHNYGEILVWSQFGYAVGVDGPGTLDNRGWIVAEGRLGAIGVRFFEGPGGVNAGGIEALVTGAGESVGVSLRMELADAAAFAFANSGDILADIALRVEQPGGNVVARAVALDNSGRLFGRVELGQLADSVVNSGIITGAVKLGDGHDSFDGRDGAQDGGVYGEAGNDSLTGGAVADLLVGGAGADILDGRGGADIFLYLAAADSTAASRDRIRAFQSGVDRIDLGALAPTSVGWVQQTDGSDGSLYQLVSIATASGAVSIRVDGALALSDFVLEGPLNLVGTPAGETLAGGGGNDMLAGLGGADLLQGLAGNDVLDGGAGADRMEGGGGDDLYQVDDAGDLVVEAAGAGNDRVIASVAYALGGDAEVEALEAAAGTAAINLTGNYLAQTLIGNAGANILHGGGGADLLRGLSGNDTYYADLASVQVEEGDGGGVDRLFVSLSYALAGGGEIELLSTNDHGATAAINLTGNHLAQTLIGNAGENILHGGGGTDLLIGLGGRDIYYVDVASTSLIEYEGGGNDALYVSVSYVLVNGEVEVLSTNNHAATDPLNLTGNLYNQTLIGNAGNNVLNGGGGTDLLIGLAGNDTFYVDVAATAILEYEGGGNDALYVSSSYVLVNGEVETLSVNDYGSTLALNLTGNLYSQTLIGNAGNNVLNGGGGVDSLIGLGGNDTYYIDVAGTQAHEAAGAGTDAIYTSISYALAAGNEVEILSSNNYGATDAISLTGNASSQVVTGNAGANTINGGAGADTLHGLGGADNFEFTTALGAGNVDTIADFSVADDNIQLDDSIFTALGGPGALNANAFATGAAASDADDRIVYNSATGQLLYDADGNGAGAAIQFATLATGLTLTANDFQVI